jgi:hypothetical protein
MSTRINARLDDALARQLDEIRRMTGQTLTELLEAALVAYCRDLSRTAKNPYAAFEKAGFIGAGAGPKDLSRNAKEYLRKSLGRKA